MNRKSSGRGFFSLPKFYWQLSDAEHVELARTRARWAKRLRWPLITMWIGIITGAFALLGWIASALADTDGLAISESAVWQGALVGASIGFFMGMAVAIGIFFIYVSFADGRRDELLVKIWDEFQQRRAGVSDEPSGSSQLNPPQS